MFVVDMIVKTIEIEKTIIAAIVLVIKILITIILTFSINFRKSSGQVKTVS